MYSRYLFYGENIAQNGYLLFNFFSLPPKSVVSTVVANRYRSKSTIREDVKWYNFLTFQPSVFGEKSIKIIKRHNRESLNYIVLEKQKFKTTS